MKPPVAQTAYQPRFEFEDKTYMLTSLHRSPSLWARFTVFYWNESLKCWRPVLYPETLKRIADFIVEKNLADIVSLTP